MHCKDTYKLLAMQIIDKRIHTTVEIFFERRVARTRQRYSVGVDKGGLPFLGTGLLCPLTIKNRKVI